MAQRAVGVGHDRVVAPYEDVLWCLPARIVVAVGHELRVIAYVQAARLERGAEDARRIARLARQEAGAVVGRAEALGHVGAVAVDVAAGALGHPDGFGAVLLDDLAHLALDDVVGLIPRDALERVLAAIGASSLLRVQQAVGMVEHLVVSQAPRAQAPLVIGVVGIAFHVVEHAILHVHEHAAVVVAARARAGARPVDGEVAVLPGPLAASRVVLGLVFRHSLVPSFALRPATAPERRLRAFLRCSTGSNGACASAAARLPVRNALSRYIPSTPTMKDTQNVMSTMRATAGTRPVLNMSPNV